MALKKPMPGGIIGVIALSLLTISLLSSCTPSDSRTGGAEYRKGTEGLAISFLSNMPPDRMFDQGPLQVVVSMENKGAYDIEDARLYIHGYDKDIVDMKVKTNGNEKNPQVSGVDNGNYEPISNGDGAGDGTLTSVELKELKGRDINSPQQGGKALVEFTSDDIYLKNVDQYMFPISATLCYKYHTIAEESICIDPNPYTVSEKIKACTTYDVLPSGGQGAPVAVTAIEVHAMKGKMLLTIRVKNLGGGILFDSDSNNLDDCSPYSQKGLTYDKLDVVNLNSVKISGKDDPALDKCKGKIRLFDGEGSVVCEYVIKDATQAYTTPIRIELEYGYTTSITRNVEIVKVPGIKPGINND